MIERQSPLPAEEAGIKRHQTRGRKPKYESRAPEFRQRLILWKQTPEPSRPTLRALGRDLGVSHQLLGYYLEGLEDWECEERYRAAKERAKQKAEQIRARAKAENREMTMREYCEAIIAPSFHDQIEELRQEAKRGPLYRDQIQLLKILARQGFAGAKELLQKCSQQKIRRRPTFEEEHPEWRLHKLISQVGERGGVLWLDDEGRVIYSVPSMDSNSRALMAKIWKHREEVKRIIGDQVTRLKEQGRYEEIKAKICQHSPPERLSPLDELNVTGATLQRARGERQHGIA